MKSKGVIIQGSSKSQGNTNKIVLQVMDQTGYELIDLKTKSIGPFDYEFKNSEDDFIPLMRSLVENYDTIVFATPIYWYTMSGILKNFLDRISDCLKVEKELGRKLRGKRMAVISCGSGLEIKDGFIMPFVESANYLGMTYLGDVHTWVENGKITEGVGKSILEFSELLSKRKNFVGTET